MKNIIDDLIKNENVKRVDIYLSNGEHINIKAPKTTCITGYDTYFIIYSSDKKHFINYSQIVKISVPSEE